MLITQAILSDSEELLALQKLAYQSEAELNNDHDIPPLTQTLTQYIEEFPQRLILKIEKNDCIIASGQAYIENNTCYIGRLIVHPEFQGQGFGSAILDQLEQKCSSAKRFELFTGAKSIRNLQLYQRKGYKIFKQEVLGKTTVIFLEKCPQANHTIKL